MAVRAETPLDVTVTGSVTISALGPIGFAMLFVAIALLVAGVWITARAALARPRAGAGRHRRLADLLGGLVQPRGRAPRASSPITAIVAPTTIAPPRTAAGGIDSPSTSHASTTVITGDTA